MTAPRRVTPLGRALATIKQQLAPHSDTPALDAQTLATHILGKSRAWLLAHPEYILSPKEEIRLAEAAARLQAGVPLPYVVGSWEFYGLRFTLTPDVLIPRPETELLVEQALAWLRHHPERRLAVDVGTGSGCIAITLAAHCADLQMLATDLSRAALAVARANASLHNVAQRIHFIQADLLSLLHGVRFDLICANPPYIPSATLQRLPIYGREPGLALDGGEDGLRIIRPLLAQARRLLRPGGLLLMEIEASLGAAARQLARRLYPQAKVDVLPDLAGHDRLLRIQRK